MDNRNSGTTKRAITVYVPGNVCNFRCSYCYVSECLRDGHEQAGHFNYSVEHMVEAFRPERIGGKCAYYGHRCGRDFDSTRGSTVCKRVASFRTCCRACYK